MALDPRAVERVLARAAELHAARPGGDGGLSEADVLAAAREAGLEADAVRLALAEERLRALGAGPAARGGDTLAERVAGPGYAAAERVLAGGAGAVLDALGALLEREECMRLVRRTGGADAAEAAWEPRRDVLGNLSRGLRGASPALRRVSLVTVAALPAGGDGPDAAPRVLVRLEADLGGARRTRLAAGAVAAGGGAAAGGSILGLGAVAHAMLAVVAPLAVVPVLAGGVAAWAIARGHRGAVDRASAALERLLDRAEVDARRPAALPGRGQALLEVIDGVRRAIGR